MTQLRLSALACLLAVSACALPAPAPEEEVIIVDPIIEEPTYTEFEKDGIDCTADAITGDGIGGTGCPAID